MEKSRILKGLDYLFVLRPSLFFPAWTIVLVGAFAAQRFEGHWTPLGFWKGTLIFGLYTLIVGAVYLLNNIMDQDNDAANGKVFLISEDYLSPRHASQYLVWILVVVGVLSLMVSRSLFLWFLGIFLVWGVLYSAPPFALKDKPMGGVFISAISGIGLFAFGWWLYAPVGGIALWWHAIPYVLAWVSISLLTTIPDSNGDALDNKQTIAVTWGHDKTQDNAFLLLILALLGSLLTWDWVIGISSLLALPLYVKMKQDRSVASTLRVIRWGVSFLSFTMFIVYPVYFFSCFIVFFLSRWYYRERFGINYPTFRVNDDEVNS